MRNNYQLRRDNWEVATWFVRWEFDSSSKLWFVRVEYRDNTGYTGEWHTVASASSVSLHWAMKALDNNIASRIDLLRSQILTDIFNADKSVREKELQKITIMEVKISGSPKT